MLWRLTTHRRNQPLPAPTPMPAPALIASAAPPPPEPEAPRPLAKLTAWDIMPKLKTPPEARVRFRQYIFSHRGAFPDLHPHTKAVVVWELQEMTFRFELWELDRVLRRLYPEIAVRSDGDRLNDVLAVWGGDSLIPTSTTNPLLNPYDKVKHRAAYEAFRELIQPWPRLPAGLKAGQSVEEMSKPRFDSFRLQMWRFYNQTYYDYFARYAPLPTEYPKHPPHPQDVE